MQPFRPDPLLPVQAMQTYEILQPVRSHFRVAPCSDVNCKAQANGWVTRIDESTPLGQRQAYYIRKQSGRAFKETREANLVVFSFEPGQLCFASHKVPLDRPAFFVVRGGDFRGNPSGFGREHTRPEFWVEDMSSHLDRLKTDYQKG